MIVVDATVWVDALRGLLPDDLAAIIRSEGCASPAHVDFEVGSALIRLGRRGELTRHQARELIGAFARHPVERVYDASDAQHAAELLDNATFADAWYLALAARLDIPLLTLDEGMRVAANIQGVAIVPGHESG